MPFSNEVIGTNGALIRNWMKSENYVAGVSGWQIKKDGNAEFNNGTFRGSIEVGPDPGQHFIVNNPATGDVVDIYDNTNALVTKIDKSGEIITTNGSNSAIMFGNGYAFANLAAPPGSQGGMSGTSSSSGSQVVIDSGRKQGGVSSSIFFLDNINGPSGQASLMANQRGLGQGAILQTDNFSATNNYTHAGVYSATVSGTGGMATFNHGCTFTPTGGVVAPLTHFSQWNWNDAFGVHGFTSSQAQITTFQPTGSVLASGTVPTFFGLFWG